MYHKGTLRLSDGALVLRRFTPSDAQAMFDTWAADSEVTRFLTWEPHPDVEVTRALLALWVESYENIGTYQWAIEWEGKLAGSLSMMNCSDRNESAEIGYCLGRAFWGQGIMTRAVRLVQDFMFGQVGLHRMLLRHARQNPASGRVAQKTGFVCEGTDRQAFRLKDGTWADTVRYGLLREEWEKLER